MHLCVVAYCLLLKLIKIICKLSRERRNCFVCSDINRSLIKCHKIHTQTHRMRVEVQLSNALIVSNLFQLPIGAFLQASSCLQTTYASQIYALTHFVQIRMHFKDQ